MDQATLRDLVNSYGGTGKRFIMFDQSGDRGRIVFEPNRFYELNPSAPPSGESCEFHRVYRQAMASFAAFQSMRERSAPNSVTLCDISTPFSNKDSDSSTSKLSWDHVDDGELQSSVRAEDEDDGEDLEDIDALLYSEDDDNAADEVGGEMEGEGDECSTGHTPVSDVTRDESSDEITSAYHGNHSEAPVAPPVLGKDKNRYKSPSKSRGQRSVAAQRRIAMKKHRKDRIWQTVKALQSIVPGGDSMDPAVVLDEAIHYMKVLQMRVRQLEVSRQEDLASVKV